MPSLSMKLLAYYNPIIAPPLQDHLEVLEKFWEQIVASSLSKVQSL